jgi:hypothetical protein
MIEIRKAACLAFTVALGLAYGCGSSTTPGPVFVLDGKTYTEKFTCNKTLTAGGPVTCPDLNATDVIQFQYVSGTTFVVHDVPDTGFLYTGTLSGMTFTWTATSAPADAYTESGSWTFEASGATFSGSSHYVADDGSFQGDCNVNGAIGTATVPPDPPSPAGCP